MQLLRSRFDRIFHKTNLQRVADVIPSLKESFKDILQEFMEAELDASWAMKKSKGVIFSNG